MVFEKISGFFLNYEKSAIVGLLTKSSEFAPSNFRLWGSIITYSLLGCRVAGQVACLG